MRSEEYGRVVYSGSGLEGLGSGDTKTTVLELFESWWAQALADPRVGEPAAASLATFDAAGGLPDNRILLIKDFDAGGLRFFTNLDSAKGRQLETTPDAAAVMLWHPMFRQVRFRGPVERTTRDEDREYWVTRPQASQLASWSSSQSAPVASREAVTAGFAAAESRFRDTEVPLPEQWGGYRLRPAEVEFWVGMPARLHDRVLWRTSDGRPRPLDSPDGWESQRLQP
ncbi:pyridoxamine 5'-phosphate oxidase [Kocuria coralli]|uniref:Pyridoxamine 5'-phosphate oxidase n=1 Tax=Kocuria coralli TaxID=1461025 RepID=A0A5J5KWA9_9MICC|nr:pyridoxamine 5'-phosphate oxidase [Kocuria coralli]KAA9393156.1 pyridoxamine 5'-phosphate oxidase [Kocuria coralli]